MFEEIWNYLLDVGQVLLFMPVEFTEKFYFLYIVTCIALAYLSYRRYYRHRTRRGFWRFLFPKAIYLHRSAKVDYGIFLINVVLSPLILVGAGLQALISTQVGGFLIELNDGSPVFAGDWGVATYAVFILGFTLVADLSVYLIHRFHHANSVFWPLHALHHSAQVMTPVTLFRKHPIYDVFGSFFKAFIVGAVLGTTVFFLTNTVSLVQIAGVSAFYFAFNLLGANFRHSHIWLGYGKVLSHILVSPAQHQIHHSVAVKHHNKNYGEVLAIWDWMFGTLYVPDAREELTYGIGDETGVGIAQPHGSLSDALIVPFEDSWRALKEREESASTEPKATKT